MLKEVEDKIDYVEATDPRPTLKDLDILYVTRILKERFVNPADYEKVKDTYVVDRAFLKETKRGLAVMHPLPRVSEISTDVDNTAQAWYFKQMKHGVYIRMALLALAPGRP